MSYKAIIWKEFKKSKAGILALWALGLICLIGIYAPLFASSKPLVVFWDGHFYFPLVRYLFFSGFYTKPIDLFFNILMFSLPASLICMLFTSIRAKKVWLISIGFLHIALFTWAISGAVKDPEHNYALEESRKAIFQKRTPFHEDPLLAPLTTQTNWDVDLRYLTPYGKLNQLLKYHQIHTQHKRLKPYRALFVQQLSREMPTLWHVRQRHLEEQRARLQEIIQVSEKAYKEANHVFPTLIQAYLPFSHTFIMAKYALEHASLPDQAEAEKNLENILKIASAARLPLVNARQTITDFQNVVAEAAYLEDKEVWLKRESQNLHILIPSLVRAFHWEEDAGGAQMANRFLPWWELTRVNRKDLISSLLFGIRVSLVVGVFAVSISLLIGIPIGMLAGYFGSKTDLVLSRFIEMWEAMPTFFMLLLISAIMQNKSLFMVISVLGIFGWTSIARFIRSEVLKQRQLAYIFACKSMGFTHGRIMFSHIFPNAFQPILTLLPFSIMGAITAEAALSFLGLGEEGSSSWGVLMDEGRSVFPTESYLLWPPAILLTLLLISIAILGDRLRDALDPKLR